MVSCDRLVDEIANDFMLLCAQEGGYNDGHDLHKRLSLFSSLLSAPPSNSSDHIFLEQLNREADRLNTTSVPSDFRNRLAELKRMQRLRLQKLEHEMMAKLINRNGDKSTLLDEELDIRQSLAAHSDDLKRISGSEEVRRLAANLLWHLASGLEGSFQTDPPDDELPEVDSDDYDLS